MTHSFRLIPTGMIVIVASLALSASARAQNTDLQAIAHTLAAPDTTSAGITASPLGTPVQAQAIGPAATPPQASAAVIPSQSGISAALASDNLPTTAAELAANLARAPNQPDTTTSTDQICKLIRSLNPNGQLPDACKGK